MGDPEPVHRRDRHLTIYGRMPVAEALADTTIPLARVFVADQAHGEIIQRIEHAARARGVPLERVTDARVALLARNGRHHQGVAADIAPPGLDALASFLDQRHGRRHATSLLVLDGVHNPSNVGMIIRSAVGAGLDGIVVPRRGTAELGPLVLKASAGVALRAVLLRSDTIADAAVQLRDARFVLVGLDGTHPDVEPLDRAELPERAAYVLGNESDGLSADVSAHLDRRLAIRLSAGVESLNVACAATLVAFEVARRRPR